MAILYPWWHHLPAQSKQVDANIQKQKPVVALMRKKSTGTTSWPCAKRQQTLQLTQSTAPKSGYSH